MDQKQFVKQMIDFHKTSFDNSFNAMVMLQEQTEKLVSAVLEQATWLPDDGKNVLNQWIGAYKNGRDDFKKTVDDNFKKVEEYFSAGDKPKK